MKRTVFFNPTLLGAAIIGAAGAFVPAISGSAQAATFGLITDLRPIAAADTVQALAPDAAVPVILVGTTHIVCPGHKIQGTRPPRK
jgi:hypothetical protein